MTPSGIPRYRPWSGPALLAQGFRPFFLAAALWAMVVLALWLLALHGLIVLPTAFDPLSWHVHEMLFGFVLAAMAGFLLTAIPNWTGRMPLQGWPLALLVALWVAGRGAVLVSAWIGAPAAAAVDLALPLALLAVVAREIVSGRNWRNLPMVAGLIVLLAADAAMHAEMVWPHRVDPGVGWRLGIAAMLMLVALIGGRIVPSFTRNWLAKRAESRLPAPFGRFDAVCLGVLFLWCALWVAVPDEPATGVVAALAGAAHAARLARWCGHRTLPEPLVWSLHLAYAWLPLGLVLLAVAAVVPTVPPSAGIHALTAGALAGMILAVTTRATLGHSGRALSAGPATTLIYAAVAGAAAARVAAALWPQPGAALLMVSGTAWLLAFGLFCATYGPMLARARAA